MDRSSKERSRFEKLDAAFVRLEIACQDVRDALDEFRETRAALEDRQEAAPHVGGVCPKCHWFICQCQVPGVPSEATPSKENAPPVDEPCAYNYGHGSLCRVQRRNHNTMREHGNSHDWTAPAPEVQGTPKFNLEESLAALQKLQDKFAAEHPDIVAAATKGTDGGSGMAAQNSPVGTPQKETPSSISAESSSPLQLAEEKTVPEGVRGLEPKTTPRRKCGKCGAKTYWHGDTWYHCDGADVAKCGMVEPQTPPEGVQGKEPPHETPEPKQAPTEYQQVSRQIMARMRELHIPIPEGDCGPLQFFNAACASREAAGWRSAITELQERIAAYYYGNFNAKIALAWCAELQEKTK